MIHPPGGGTLKVAYKHGNLQPSPKTGGTCHIAGEVASLDGEAMVSFISVSVQVQPSSKRLSIVPHKETIFDICGDICEGFIDKYAHSSSPTKVVMVIKSKIDLFRRVLGWKVIFVVCKLGVLNVYKGLPGWVVGGRVVAN